jgi:hypothetical protein
MENRNVEDNRIVENARSSTVRIFRPSRSHGSRCQLYHCRGCVEPELFGCVLGF